MLFHKQPPYLPLTLPLKSVKPGGFETVPHYSPCSKSLFLYFLLCSNTSNVLDFLCPDPNFYFITSPRSLILSSWTLNSWGKKKQNPIITKHSLLFLFSTETLLCAATVTEACMHHRISFKGEFTDQLKGMWTATIYSCQCLPGWPQLKRVSLSQVTLFLGAGCSLSEVRPAILTQISDTPVGSLKCSLQSW